MNTIDSKSGALRSDKSASQFTANRSSNDCSLVSLFMNINDIFDKMEFLGKGMEKNMIELILVTIAGYLSLNYFAKGLILKHIDSNYL